MKFGSQQVVLACRMEAHGTCWHECRCDGAGDCTYAEGDCADFTCDSAKWRRQPGKSVCVKDECSRVRSYGFVSYVALTCGVSVSLHAAPADGLYAAMRRQGSVCVVMRAGQTCEHMASSVLALWWHLCPRCSSAGSVGQLRQPQLSEEV